MAKARAKSSTKAEPTIDDIDFQSILKFKADMFVMKIGLNPADVADMVELAAKGQEFVTVGKISSCPILAKHFAKTKAKAKECFDNCQRAALALGDVVAYCEGMATTGIKLITMHHAWLAVDGVVYDPTLELTTDGKRHRYFGMTFTAEQVAAHLVPGKENAMLVLS
ncbi:MAG: hypothetical protein K1X57_00785 [Gemmataceae bacterium]|nr:hypothetical protein [Gemmataceae bacterium]